MSGSSAASVVTGFGTVGTSGLVRAFVTGFFDALTVAILRTFVVGIGQRDGGRTDAFLARDNIRGRAGGQHFFVAVGDAGTAFSVRGTGEQGITLAGIAAVMVGGTAAAPALGETEVFSDVMAGEAEVVLNFRQEGGAGQQKGIGRL